jgi:signal transduction histidine kinase
MTSPNEEYSEQLLSIVSHELKTPVGAMRGFLSLLQQAGPLNDRQQLFLDRAMMAVDRIEGLIANLLDEARLEDGVVMKVHDCDLGQILHDSAAMLEPLASKRSIRFEIGVPPGAVIVRGDERLLTQVMNNLLSNAVKYNRDNGQVWVSAHGEQNHLRIEIRDSGIGISADDLSRVFDRFYRARLGEDVRIDGSGLGLSITRTIVKMHGGDIQVESKLGEGTTFSVLLPAPASKSTKPNARGRKKGRKPEPIFEPASESSDDVDDNRQEAAEVYENDSKSDER